MNCINNFSNLKDFLNFSNPDYFYWIQIIKRRKDNLDMNSGERIVDNFYISSLADFNKMQPIIIDICNINHARAYLYVNRRSYQSICNKSIQYIANYIESKQYDAIKNIFHKSCGNSKVNEDKYWIIDIDSENPQELIKFCNETIYLLIHESRKFKKDILFDEIINIELPTLNGVHLIIKRFNREKFIKIVESVDLQKNISIHENNATLLYF
jgi:hypothetical protein